VPTLGYRGCLCKLCGSRWLPTASIAASFCFPVIEADVQAQRSEMAAEDGRQLFEECQKITQKITWSMSNGWSAGSR
jgi:hypothetical protein